MVLWKIEHENKSKREIAKSKTNQEKDQQNQFQDGTYEKVLVLLKVNKQEAHVASKRASKMAKVETTK